MQKYVFNLLKKKTNFYIPTQVSVVLVVLVPKENREKERGE